MQRITRGYDLNVSYLLAFAAVAERGNVSAAAGALGVSQPAVSKQVAALERHVGAKLLERSARGVRLTRAGEMLAEHARRLASAKAQAERAVAAYLGMEEGRLAVGATATIAVHLLPDVFVEFRRAHPGIAQSARMLEPAEVRRGVGEGALDVGLTESEATERGMVCRAFATDELVVVVRPGHALAGERNVTAARLGREPFVVRETGSAGGSLAERVLAGKGVVPTVVMSLNGTEAIKRAVAAGVGVAILPRLAVGREVRAGELATVSVAGLTIRRPVFVITRAGDQTPAVRAFGEVLERAVRRHPDLSAS